MCCLSAIVTASLETGADQVDLLNAICSGSSSENAPLDSLPPSVVRVASPAVEMTFAVVEAVYVLSTPGVNALKVAGAPSVSDSVAGTVPPIGGAGVSTL